MLWKKLGLIAELLRPITIEIGIIEARGTSLSDIIQRFGRLWAYFETKTLVENRLSFLPGILTVVALKALVLQLLHWHIFSVSETRNV